jgi:hypothetical protein
VQPFGLQTVETGGLYLLVLTQVQIVIVRLVVQHHFVQLETVPQEMLQHTPALVLIVLVTLVHHFLALVFLVLAFPVHHLPAQDLLEGIAELGVGGALVVLQEIDSVELEIPVQHITKLETVKLGMLVVHGMLETATTTQMYVTQTMQLPVQVETVRVETVMQETVRVETVMQETVQ